MTCSFSSGENVQVEYNSIPPGANSLIASSTISRCNFAYGSLPFCCQFLISLFPFRNIPSPEHGASIKILLKKPVIDGTKYLASVQRIISFLIPNISILRINAFVLDILTSLDTKSPSPFNFAPSSVDFPPGAPHRSSTRSPGSTGR